MPFRHPRQIPSGITTFSASAGPSNSLDLNPSQSGTDPALPIPTITISSTESPTPTTESASSTATSTSAGASTSKLSIGTIIGIIVGIFAVLAIALVAFMTIRHKKTLERSRARAKSITRKSWSRLKDEKPTELQMRATSQTASISDAKTGMDDPSSLVPSPPAQRMHPETALPSRNPNYIPQGLSKRNSGAPAPPPSRSVDESHIPNPFASPTVTPTHSRSPSHTTSSHSSEAQHSLALAALSSFSENTPQYAHASIITASSASEYPPEQSSVRANPSDAVKSAEPTQSRLSRKQSAKVAEESRSRELKAMQDLISALDERAQDKRTPPSAFNLNVDTNPSYGKSRLSLGEGLVTPGGHSIRDEDVAYDEDGNTYWEHDPLSSFAQQEFPLPPADVFRAALSPSDAKAKASKETGKSSNPFQG